MPTKRTLHFGYTSVARIAAGAQVWQISDSAVGSGTAAKMPTRSSVPTLGQPADADATAPPMLMPRLRRKSDGGSEPNPKSAGCVVQ